MPVQTMLALLLLIRVTKGKKLEINKEMAMKTTKTTKRDKAGRQMCIWSEAGVVSSRSCTRGLDCERCLFDQNMMDFFAANLTPLPALPRAA
jgi:hypothetical protein